MQGRLRVRRRPRVLRVSNVLPECDGRWMVAAEELEEGENPCVCYKCLGRALYQCAARAKSTLDHRCEK